MVIGRELIRLGFSDSDDDAVAYSLNVTPLEEVLGVELLPGLGDHVGGTGHREEHEKREGLESEECGLLNGARGSERDGVQQVG